MFIFIANLLTVLRGILGAAGALWVVRLADLTGWGLCLAMCFFAGLTDLFDGMIARKTSGVSNFGKIADPVADKVLVLGLLFAFAWRHLFSFWWIVIIFLREVAVTGARFRLLAKGKVIPAETAGKLKTTVQMFMLLAAFFLLGAIFGELGQTVITGLRYLLYALLIAANCLTLVSGYRFFRALRQPPAEGGKPSPVTT